MKNCLLSFLTILLSCTFGLAQEKFESAALQEDLMILSEITNGLSPKLTSADRTRINKLAENKKKELEGKSLNSIEFFNFLAQIDFDSKFDEHASLSITQEVLMPLLTKSKLFPLPVKIFNGNKVVVNSAEAELPYGSILHSINGVSLDSLLESFTDKYEDTFVKSRLEIQFSIIYLIKKGSFEAYEIDYYSPAEPSERLTKSVKGIDFESYMEVFQNTVYPLNKSELSQLINTKYHEEKQTYYLQLNNFSWDDDSDKGFFDFLNSDHKKFDKRFKSVFDEISEHGAKNLIIDLRSNMGGNVRVPGTFFKYIALEEFNEDVRIEMQDFNIPRTDLVLKVQGEKVEDANFMKKFIRNYKMVFRKQNDSTYLWPIMKNETVSPAKNGFKGNVYLLVGGRSISASAYFTSLFKSENRGVILGEQMGGSYRSLSAGKILTYQLPNTKIELNTPIMLVNFDDSLYQKIGEDRITPDVLFDHNERYQFMLNKRDVELEKVYELIRKNDSSTK